jgi:hypothetical protein
MSLKEKGYVYIENLFSKEECNLCIDRMFNTIPNNNSIDTQCPLSDNYYNIFRDMLISKQNVIEKYVGLKLLPSYSYSRIYKKGEILGVHRDREACEITVTATFGFDGLKVWPIHMSLKDDVKSFEINSGDGLAMDGMNYDHWRNEYVEGNWQAQVFLHYVDANGPFTMHANDAKAQKDFFGVDVNY